jgi:hypothetical protein
MTEPEPRHYYRRQDWRCTACGEDWPCAARRAAFLAKYTGPGDKARLRGILGALQLDAERDLVLDSEEAYQRFVAWTYAPLP